MIDRLSVCHTTGKAQSEIQQSLTSESVLFCLFHGSYLEGHSSFLTQCFVSQPSGAFLLSEEETDCMHVQGDGLLLEQEEVPFDAKLLEETISRHLHFWNGVSAPTKVPQDEQWKCRNCTFNTKCWPALKKIVPWQH